MTNETKEVQNVHQDVDKDKQELLETKAKQLVEFMNAEPKARLIPNLRVSQDGILPDVRLVLIEDDPEPDQGTETESEGDAGDSEDETGTTESVSSQDS